LVASLYFHIPFCKKKCPYCHFYSIPNKSEFLSSFLSAVKLECDRKLPSLAGKKIASVYFGGGTPTLFSQGINAILSSLPLPSDCEITVEANPDGIDRALLEDLRECGINRLSLGVQSLDDASLQVLERRHSARQSEQAIEEAAKAGFENISIDLMYDLPGQTEESWQKTLDRLPGLPITHVSLYNLTIEPHTVYYLKREAIRQKMPDDALSLRLLQRATDALEQCGFQRYEISAFAKNGLASVHNTGYWTGRPFLGFGPSAFSYWEGKRFRNIANLPRYQRLLSEGKSPVDFEEELAYPDNVKELLAIGLRRLEGVQEDAWPLPPESIDALHRLQEEGFLEQDGRRWKLTEKGLLFYDTVAEELI
jgi:oxygen-independent coproporphyrinogen III oxidase